MDSNELRTKRMKREKRKLQAVVAGTILMGLIVLVVLYACPVKFDYAAGTHRIIPTAVDSDIWGNYKVYYKTSDFTQNKNDSYYYIDKDRHDLAAEIDDAISAGDEIVTHYDKYIGWKGFTAPASSPITKIERVPHKTFKDHADEQQ